MNSVKHFWLSFFSVWIAAVLGQAIISGYPIENGLISGAIFGTMALIFLFPVVISVGFAFCALVELMFSLPHRLKLFLRFYAIFPFVAVFLYDGCQTYFSDGYRRYVSDDKPSSVKVVERVALSGFGYRSWAIALEVDPSQSDSIFTRYEYELVDLSKEGLAEEFGECLLEFSGFEPVFKEYELTEMHRYQKSGPPLSTGFSQVVFGTSEKNRFIIFGSSD